MVHTPHSIAPGSTAEHHKHANCASLVRREYVDAAAIVMADHGSGLQAHAPLVPDELILVSGHRRQQLNDALSTLRQASCMLKATRCVLRSASPAMARLRAVLGQRARCTGGTQSRLACRSAPPSTMLFFLIDPKFPDGKGTEPRRRSGSDKCDPDRANTSCVMIPLKGGKRLNR